ncbi:MAG: hypothetical protein ACI9NT_002212 [Bacteroidia bacterium]|jgi:hypothetical protein
MRVAENAYYQYRQGLLDAEAWLGFSIKIITHVGAGPVAESHWERVALSYSESFVDEVARILEWAETPGDRSVTEVRSEYIAMLQKK